MQSALLMKAVDDLAAELLERKRMSASTARKLVRISFDGFVELR